MSKSDSKLEKHLRRTEKYDREYLDATIKAVQWCENAEEAADTIEQFLGQAHRGNYFAVNPQAKREWVRCLLAAFLKTLDAESGDKTHGFGNVAPQLPLAMLTITDKGWVHPDTDIQFNLRQAQQKVRNAFKGIGMLGAFEVAVYVNEKIRRNGKIGRLVSFHAHVVVWASSLSTLKRHCQRVERRFTGMLGARSPIHIRRLDTIDECCKTLCYEAKLPLFGKKTRQTARGTRQSNARIPHPTRHRVFCHLKDYKVADLWLGSGKGALVLKAARLALYGDEAEIRKKAELQRKYRSFRRPAFGWTRKSLIARDLGVWETKRHKRSGSQRCADDSP